MLLQTAPVTRFKVGAVGSEMRQGNNTKRPTGIPICEPSQQAAGHGVVGTRVPFSFSKRSRPFHASTHDTLVNHGESLRVSEP